MELNLLTSKKIMLIPTYESTYNLINLLKELKRKSLIIIVVELSAKIYLRAEKYAKVLSYDVNIGKGCALKFGFKYVDKEYVNEYVLVTMDAD